MSTTVATEIMNVLDNISYMDVLNITNIILEYDDEDNKFIKDKKNTMIYISISIEEDDSCSTHYHIDTKDQIYQSYSSYDCHTHNEKTKKLQNLRQYKEIRGDSFELIDISIRDIIIHIDDVYYSLIPNDEDKFYINFCVGLDYKSLPCVQLHFRYILCDDDGEVEETDDERDLRFKIFLEMSEKNLNRWITRL
jgi:hypothetical protein